LIPTPSPSNKGSSSSLESVVASATASLMESAERLDLKLVLGAISFAWFAVSERLKELVVGVVNANAESNTINMMVQKVIIVAGLLCTPIVHESTQGVWSFFSSKQRVGISVIDLNRSRFWIFSSLGYELVKSLGTELVDTRAFQ
jgi:hypothetical protein